MAKKLKKILILTQDYFPSRDGITTWCYQIGKNLQNEGFKVKIITKSYDGFESEEVDDIPVLRLNHFKWRNYRNKRVLNALKEVYDDDTIVIAANWKMAVPCMIFSLRNKINYFVAVHGLDAIENRFINKYIQRLSYNRAKGLISVSNYTLGLLKDNVKLRKSLVVKIVPNGVDIQEFYPKDVNTQFLKKYNLSDSGFKILSLGRLVERKGADNVIKALSEIRDFDFHYYIAGKGPYQEKLEELISEYKLQDKVKLLGFIPDEDKVDLYNYADLYIMPSREVKDNVEGFGITYLEAAACKVPSIGGLGSGAEDAIVHNKTGILVNPNDIDDIKNAIVKLYNDKKLLELMGEEGYKRVIKDYKWANISKSIVQFINECIND